MNIILLSRKHGRPLTVQLRPRLLLTGLGVALLLCATMGVGAYWAAARFMAPTLTTAAADGRDARDQLKAMSSRMAEMQAQLMRLDALGEHLAESANLNPAEFESAAKKPPMGGPLSQDLTVLSDGGAGLQLRLQELSEQIAMKEAQLQALDSLMSGQRALPKSYLAHMPVRTGYMSSNYGYRTDPFTGHAAFHGGIDFAGAEGTHVFAVAPGIVTWAGAKTGYGNLVEISHGDGVSTRYAHASRVMVKVGDLVSKDQLVALMGSTGRSTGPHLHYEVLRDGKQVDPATYIAQARR
ncbi:MAG TPA: peptidoglycan DD-metalloendopeptidase family protein [Moraxellaceae bacterium]|nr:peptidoglycan DD-metalloendopeptidase family protein [Moraxellaceae bacterium]